MKTIKINLRDTGYFNPLFLDYIEGKKELDNFYGSKPAPDHFKEQIEKKHFPEKGRAILAAVLEDQYQATEMPRAVKENLRALPDENTFTVTTGHQLNIFSGPLYFHYKIITVVNLARELSKRYPAHRFVPVYWMASEDHDFEEINHFHLFGKKYTWETEQKGPVGRFNPSSIRSLIEKLPEKPALFTEAYLKHPTLADATRYFVNKLYGAHGLVVMDADHPSLKARFKDIMAGDLFGHKARTFIDKTNAKLMRLGYRPQAYARPINFFYMEDQRRERIVREDNVFKVLNTDLAFSETALRDLLEQHPEKFSPNVLLRTLYQERVLPNLAYVGGPAEINYWLQMKPLFDHYAMAFPILMPRNFALIVEKPVMKKLKKLKLSPEHLFLNKKDLKELYLQKHSSRSFDIAEEKARIGLAFDDIRLKAGALDSSLKGFVEAEKARSLKSLGNIEKRLRKAAEQKEETGLKQLDRILERVFPEGNLQERKINFLNFWINDPMFTDQIRQAMNPFDFKFHMLTDDE